MSESAADLDGVGGSFDLDGLKKKYRRQDTAATPRNALAAIEREILQEIACQSGRYGDRLDGLLGAMAALRSTVQQALDRGLPDSRGDAVSRAALDASIAQYNRLRTQAQQVQHYLIIHREAMGFWNHDDVFRCYPIPAALTPLSPAHTPKPPEHP
jgi:hypothetical protein